MWISDSERKRVNGRMSALRADRRPFWEHWRTLADFFLPRRYVWLQTENEARRIKSRNPHILDGTATQAARTLASGMMNGITSPTRPWFRLRLAGNPEDETYPVRVWLDTVTQTLMQVMSESNFYNAFATMYLDLVVFGTSATIIYEDPDKIIHCHNLALGEFYLGQSSRRRVNTLGREFTYKVHQVVEEFGLENCSERVQDAYRRGGDGLGQSVRISHLIEPNDEREGALPKRFAYREYYWETESNEGKVLAKKGYVSFPGVCPRWETVANDSYGSSPGMDALADVIQLQHETKAKGQALDMMVRPPMVADIQLEHRPTALVPGGMTYVHNVNGVGMKPAYTVQPPVQEMMMDIREVQIRIREMFFNDLFNMISQLETVRSATEIDARREEKLVQLGPVLERFENEALDPAIMRVYEIAQRMGLLPPPPEGFEGADLEIQYVSILSVAQRAVGVVPTERLLSMVGEVVGLRQEVQDLIDWDTVIRDYGDALGVPAKMFAPEDTVEEVRAMRAEQAQMEQMAAMAPAVVDGAKTLSETDVGGGANALQRMLGQ